MKFRNEKYNTRGSAPVRESKFVVGNGAHIISMLRNSLYSDPIKAICREIASNCRDAHREVDKESSPINITFPNSFEDNIRFKDWGPGISPSRMDGVYTKFGNSTKRGDDSETGGFGLGAKTPFAYASQFGIMTISKIECQEDINILNSIGMDETLESLKGKNLKCEYVASLGGEDQNGGVKLLIAELTDEPTGTEISLVVLSEDRTKFIDSVIESTRYWKVRPELKGATARYVDIPEDIVSGTDWSITESAESNYYHAKVQKAIVDGIEYPLDISKLYNSTKSGVSKFAQLLSKTELVISFGTGDIELTPSRETLQYDKRTIAVLEEKIDLISKEINENLKCRIKSSKTFMEACDILLTFRANVVEPGEFFWNGNLCSSTGHINLSSHNATRKFYEKKITRPDGSVDVIKTFDEVGRLDSYSIDWTSGDGGSYKLVRSTKNKYKIGATILINDKGKTVSRTSLQNFSKINGMTSKGCFYVLVATDGDIDAMKLRIKTHCKIDVSILPIENISTYEVKDTKVRAKVQRGTSEVHIFERSRKTWHKERISRTDGEGVYVSLTNRRSTIKSGKDGVNLSSWNFFKILAVCDVDTDVYGVKDEVIDKLGAKFKSLSEIIEAKKKDMALSTAELTELRIAYNELRRFSRDNIIDCIEKAGIKNDVINSLNDRLEMLKEKSERYIKIIEFYNLIGHKIPEVDEGAILKNSNKSELSDMQQSIVTKYPLLSFIDSYQYGLNNAAGTIISEYIHLIDEENKKLDAISKAS